jgi:Uncharacterized protein conserved in bacteria (DUF2252)
MMQAASDIYLGWTTAKLPDVHHFYWRQLRDMKGSPDVETMAPTTLDYYARAHARSGDPIAIAAYLGDDQFDRSVTRFSERYRTASARRSTWSRLATVGSKMTSSTPSSSKAAARSRTASGVRGAEEASPSAQSPRNP